MQAWQIIVASAVLASIAAAALFLPGAVRSPGGAASLFQTYWPAFIVVWLGVYSIAALALEHRGGHSRAGRCRHQAKPGWIGRAATCCGLASRNTSALFWCSSRLGLLPVTIATEPVFPVPAALGPSLAPAACAVAILVGVLGWLDGNHCGRIPRPGGLDGIPRRSRYAVASRDDRAAARPPGRAGPGDRGTRRTAPPARSGDRWRRSRSWPGRSPGCATAFPKFSTVFSSAGRNRQARAVPRRWPMSRMPSAICAPRHRH